MIVYVDVIAGLNLAMNSLILTMTAKLADERCSWLRIGAGALLGAVLSVVGLLPAGEWLESLPGRILISWLMVAATFGHKPLRVLLPLLALFYLCSFMIGGAVFGWLCLKMQSVGYSSTRIADPGLVEVMGVCLATVILLLFAVRRFGGHWFGMIQTYSLTILWQERSVTIPALVDSGNMLRSYWEGTPVILADYLALRPLLSEAAQAYLLGNPPETWLSTLHECHDTQWLERIRFIPYQSVGNQNILLGFRPDSLIIHGRQQDACTNRVIIGICGQPFCQTGSYSALLHPALIRGLQDKEE